MDFDRNSFPIGNWTGYLGGGRTSNDSYRFLKQMKYNKLVRDNIPEIIREKGENPISHIAEEKEYWQRLKEKLQEEVNEFLEEENEEELADVLEVIYAICRAKGINKEELEALREKKAKERGSFKKKVVLDRVE